MHFLSRRIRCLFYNGSTWVFVISASSVLRFIVVDNHNQAATDNSHLYPADHNKVFTILKKTTL